MMPFPANPTVTSNTAIDSLKAGQYTVAAASENALRAAIANPSLRLPDPRQPGQFFEVTQKPH